MLGINSAEVALVISDAELWDLLAWIQCDPRLCLKWTEPRPDVISWSDSGMIME